MGLYLVRIIVLSLCFYANCSSQTTKHSDDTDARFQLLESKVGQLERIVGLAVFGKSIQNASSVDIDVISSKRGGVFQMIPICFSATMANPRYGISANVILKFGNVLINAGHHYNKNDGIFVAPVSGVYMFYWNMVVYSPSSATNDCTELMVDGKRQAIAFSGENAAGYYHSGSNMAIVKVGRGNHTWVQTCSRSTLNIYSSSSFSGWLLYRL